jgi:hypothetical protein
LPLENFQPASTLCVVLVAPCDSADGHFACNKHNIAAGRASAEQPPPAQVVWNFDDAHPAIAGAHCMCTKDQDALLADERTRRRKAALRDAAVHAKSVQQVQVGEVMRRSAERSKRPSSAAGSRYDARLEELSEVRTSLDDDEGRGPADKHHAAQPAATSNWNIHWMGSVRGVQPRLASTGDHGCAITDGASRLPQGRYHVHVVSTVLCLANRARSFQVVHAVVHACKAWPPATASK